MRDKHILLGVTGGIAAYKSAELVRRLVERGAQVQVVMTAAAREFIGATTFQALSGRSVRESLWDSAAEAAMGHIELARWADLVLVAPASADFMARLATGRADDLLSTLCLATAAPIALAPAMNQQMWANAATQANAGLLRQRGVMLLGPASGEQACGETGAGRMLEAMRDRRCRRALARRRRRVQRQARADHRRPDARGDRSGALRQQSQLRQDGLRGRRGDARGRRRGRAGQRPGQSRAAARRALHRGRDRGADARGRAARTSGHARAGRHGRGRRLPAARGGRAQDQEAGWRHDARDDPDHRYTGDGRGKRAAAVHGGLRRRDRLRSNSTRAKNWSARTST